jgi:glycerophosphoryl diester phosphodiesterase
MGLARFLPHLGRLGRATRWRRTKGPPRVWAHRGDSKHETENTMAAFDGARRAGATGIELDVRFDRDGTVVVFHDHTLDRLAGRPGRMEDLPAVERQALRLEGKHPVPTLAEVLEHLGDLEVNVEIKAIRPGRMGELATATAKVVADSGCAAQVLLSSFDPFALLSFHRVLPEVALAYLFHAEQPLPLRRGWIGSWMGASIFHPEHVLVTDERAKAWRRAGVPVNPWTVDDAAELRRLAALGVDGVFTNDPAFAVGVFRDSIESCAPEARSRNERSE